MKFILIYNLNPGEDESATINVRMVSSIYRTDYDSNYIIRMVDGKEYMTDSDSVRKICGVAV